MVGPQEVAIVRGGVISSTATTVRRARRTKTDEGPTNTAAVIVWIVSGVVFLRILVEIVAVPPGFLPIAVGPILVMLALFRITAALIWRSGTTPGDSPLKPGNSSELKPAILFGALYAAVLLVVAAAEDFWGASGSTPPPYPGSRTSTRSRPRHLNSWLPSASIHKPDGA